LPHQGKQDVDARHKAGHDESMNETVIIYPSVESEANFPYISGGEQARPLSLASACDEVFLVWP
jgi:hypothetical protein